MPNEKWQTISYAIPIEKAVKLAELGLVQLVVK